MKSFKRHISVFEKSALACVLLLLLLTVAAQLFYQGGALALMIVMIACAVLLLFLILMPLRYDFDDEALVIVNPKPFKSKRILYTEIMYYDTVGSFLASKIDYDATEVFITYKTKGSAFKKTVSCHPQNVQNFVKTLQEKCPDLIDI